MDNSISNNATPEPNTPGNSSIDVMLNAAQYFHFQTHNINLLAPDGRHLLTIGKALTNEDSENRVYRLREQVCLICCLLGNINDTVNLPIPAVLALADLFCQVKDEWDKG